MNTYYATFFVGDTVVIKQVRAATVADAEDVCRRFATAASVILKDVYAFIQLFDHYPGEYILDEARVADLEYMSRRMKKGGP